MHQLTSVVSSLFQSTISSRLYIFGNSGIEHVGFSLCRPWMALDHSLWIDAHQSSLLDPPSSCCRYYEEKGFTVICTSRILNLLALGFTITFSAFLLLFVKWSGFKSQCIKDDTCDISTVMLLTFPNLQPTKPTSAVKPNPKGQGSLSMLASPICAFPKKVRGIMWWQILYKNRL